MATNGLHRGRLPGLAKFALRLLAAAGAVDEGAPVGCPVLSQSTRPGLGANWKQHTGRARIDRAPRGHHPDGSGGVVPGAEVAFQRGNEPPAISSRMRLPAVNRCATASSSSRTTSSAGPGITRMKPSLTLREMSLGID